MREDLTEELGGISGESSGAKTPRKGGDKGKGDRAAARPADTADYFELVYECIHTRQNFLNIVSLNSRNPIEPDIDLAILQALLKGRRSGKASESRVDSPLLFSNIGQWVGQNEYSTETRTITSCFGMESGWYCTALHHERWTGMGGEWRKRWSSFDLFSPF